MFCLNIPNWILDQWTKFEANLIKHMHQSNQLIIQYPCRRAQAHSESWSNNTESRIIDLPNSQASCILPLPKGKGVSLVPWFAPKKHRALHHSFFVFECVFFCLSRLLISLVTLGRNYLISSMDHLGVCSQTSGSKWQTCSPTSGNPTKPTRNHLNEPQMEITDQLPEC